MPVVPYHLDAHRSGDGTYEAIIAAIRAALAGDDPEAAEFLAVDSTAVRAQEHAAVTARTGPWPSGGWLRASSPAAPG